MCISIHTTNGCLAPFSIGYLLPVRWDIADFTKTLLQPAGESHPLPGASQDDFPIRCSWQTGGWSE